MAKTWTILVADDDPVVRQLSRAMLERLGLIVIEASDGEQAVEAYVQSQADLILLDANMPRMDGFAVCRKIRKLGGGADVPVIMVTSLADSDSAKRARAAGASEFVTKPVNWASLGQRIQAHLEAASTAAR
jgi:CheY-like chemotaxis protein